MDGSIDIGIANGWHVTIFHPAIWLCIAMAVVLVLVAMKAWHARS